MFSFGRSCAKIRYQQRIYKSGPEHPVQVASSDYSELSGVRWSRLLRLEYDTREQLAGRRGVLGSRLFLVQITVGSTLLVNGKGEAQRPRSCVLPVFSLALSLPRIWVQSNNAGGARGYRSTPNAVQLRHPTGFVKNRSRCFWASAPSRRSPETGRCLGEISCPRR